MSEEQNTVEEKEITTSPQKETPQKDAAAEQPKQKSVIDVLGKKEFELEQMMINAKRDAEEMIKSAKKKAGDIVVQAKKEREDILRADERLSAEDKNKKMEEEKEKIAREIEKEKEEEKKKCEEFRAKYSQNLDKAVERLVNVVVAGN